EPALPATAAWRSPARRAPAATAGCGAARAGGSALPVHLRALLAELGRFGGHALLQRAGFVQAVFGGVVAHVLGDLHRAEVRAAHRTEVGQLVRILGQGLVVELLGLLRIQAQVELVLPAELEARLGQRVVARLRARVALG